MKKATIDNNKCFVCDSFLELLVKFDSKFGKVILCKNCASKLYKKIGEKIVPQSPTNLFQNKK